MYIHLSREIFEVHALKAAAQRAWLVFLASPSGYSCGAELHALFTRRNVCILAACSSAMIWREEGM